MRVDPSYIAFEGIDGAGKTTQIDLLCGRLLRLNYTPVRLIEPTWGKLGREVRELLGSSVERDLDKEDRLFTADRRQHVEHKVQPLLHLIESTGRPSGFKIVQDRTYYSAPAYQGRDVETMLSRIDKQKEFTPPYDVVLFVDIPVEIARNRLGQRRCGLVQTERIEALERARERYHVLAERVPQMVIVDGVGDEETVAERVSKELQFSPFEPA